MKKFIILALTALMMVGCGNSTSNSSSTKIKKAVNKTPNKYEVLLSTKDKIYVDADWCYMYHGEFGTITELKDKDGNTVQVIHNPVYVKKVTK